MLAWEWVSAAKMLRHSIVLAWEWVSAVKMLRYSNVLAWEWVSAAIFSVPEFS